MTLHSGMRLGPYEVVSPLGAGGMGEVYRARDTRLGRTVAIKVLPSDNASEGLRLRFEREGRVISSLGHPNICTLHDVGSENGVDYLVMEYLEGETLDERLRKGPMPVAEVLARGIEIADALEKAHRSGVVHRDLKPANVMLTKGGAKLLDFGLAKSVETEAVVINPSQATEQKPITTEGMIVGTFQYMAPEQIEGKQADARTDIFAFGAVLYEMLTGKRAFEGKSRASMIAAILATNPPAISSIQPLTPAALDRIVRICLVKDPDERWQTAHDLKLELAGVLETPATGVTTRRHSWRTSMGWIVAALVFAAATTAAIVGWQRNHRAVTSFEYEIMPPAGLRFDAQNSTVALSPDGRRMCVRMQSPGSRPRLYVRDADSREMRALDGTDAVFDAFWSPDGKTIGFFSDDKLKRVDANGGPVTTICDAGDSRGGTWAPDGTILFTSRTTGPIERVPATGGKPVDVTHLDKSRGEFGHWRPQILPDGRHFLFIAMSTNPDQSGIYVGSLDSPVVKRILDVADATVYALPGYLLYVHDGNLFAQKFDPSKLETEGAPVGIARSVDASEQFEAPGFSVSRTGLLAYHLREAENDRPVEVLDLAGKQMAMLDVTGSNLDLSRDGTRIALQRSEQSQSFDIWVYDLARRVSSRVTFASTADVGPVWSPDDKRIAYVSGRTDGTAIVICPSSGASGEERILTAAENLEVVDWSRDGRYLLVEHQRLQTKRDLDVVDLSKRPATLEPLVTTPFTDMSGRFSPDGKWVAYASIMTGQFEVYVEPFPGNGSRWQISSSGGDAPRWSGDSRRLFYVTRDQNIIEVSLTPTDTGLAVGQGTQVAHIPSNDYVVDSAGKKLIASQVQTVAPQPIVVMMPWYQRAKQ